MDASFDKDHRIMMLRPPPREELLREQERAPALTEADEGGTVPTIDVADPGMTREARAERTAWRRAHPAEWQRELKTLYHFDPDFIYDPAHEYDQESTTDPDYGADGIHFLEYDEDGVASPLERRAGAFQKRGANTASDFLVVKGLEGDYGREVRFLPETIARANQAGDESHPVKKGVRPDMLIRAAMSVSERERFMPNGVLRLDLGAPVPPLVLEVLSRNWAHRDLNYKKRLYAAAGISEYLVYDLGGKRWTGSPRELLMFRLESGSYRQDPVADVYRSAVFNTHVRIVPDVREREEARRGIPEEERSPPRFQLWDGGQNRWRDTVTDAEVKQERTVQERDQSLRERDQATQEWTDMAVAMVRSLLSRELAPADLDRIEEAWRIYGPPTDAGNRILEVQATPGKWRPLLLDGAESDNNDTRPHH